VDAQSALATQVAEGLAGDELPRTTPGERVAPPHTVDDPAGLLADEPVEP
jgi:hypothetical protein